MPRTAKTDPYDHPCWVDGCNNVGGKYRVCETHLRQVTTYDDSMRRASECFTVTHRLREKNTRMILRACRASGLKIVKQPAYAELDRR